MIQLRSILSTYTRTRGHSHSLFPNRTWLSHLGTGAAVEAKANQPRALTIVYLLVPRLSFRRLRAHSTSFAVQIQVSGHAVPSPMLLDYGK